MNTTLNTKNRFELKTFSRSSKAKRHSVDHGCAIHARNGFNMNKGVEFCMITIYENGEIVSTSKCEAK